MLAKQHNYCIEAFSNSCWVCKSVRSKQNCAKPCRVWPFPLTAFSIFAADFALPVADFMLGNSAGCQHRNTDGQQDFNDFKISAEFARLKVLYQVL